MSNADQAGSRNGSGRGSSLSAGFIAALLALMAFRGLGYLCILPPFDAWDEYQHVAYIDALNRDPVPPILGKAKVSKEFIDRLIELPQHKFILLQLGRFGAVDYKTYWERSERHSAPANRAGGTIELYEAQHGPLYYRLALPIYRALGGVSNLKGADAALRVANLLCTIAAAGVVFFGIGKLIPNRSIAALSAAVVALHPLFLANSMRAGNDALGVFLAESVIVLCLVRRRSWTIGFGSAVGLLIGIAILAKAINFALAPFALACWTLSFARSGATRLRALGAGIACALACLATVQGELRHNLSLYGGLTPMQESVKNRTEGKTIADTLRCAGKIDWVETFEDLWLRRSVLVCGWGFVKPSPKVLRFYETTLMLGLCGWAIAAIRRLVRPRCEPEGLGAGRSLACLALLASLALAQAYHVVQSKLAWGYATTNPWYAAAGFPWLFVLGLGGASGWLRRSELGCGVIAAGLAGVFVVAEASVVWGAIPIDSTCASGGMIFSRLANLQPAWLGTPTLVIAGCGALASLTFIAYRVVMLLAPWRPGDQGQTESPGRSREPRAVRRPIPRRRASGARRSVRALFWFAGLLIAGQVGLDALIRSRPELADKEFGRKLRLLENKLAEHPGRPLILGLGSSRLATGFDPMTFESTLPRSGGAAPIAFNFAMVGSGPEMMHLTLSRLLDRGIRPACVVIEYWPPFWAFARGVKDYEQQINLGALSYKEARLLAGYVPRPGRLMNAWLRMQALPVYANRHALAAGLLPGSQPEPKERELRFEFVDQNGWWKPHDAISEPDRLRLVARYREHYQPTLASLTIQPSSRRAMDHLLELCEKERIVPLVAVLPEGGGFRSWYSAESERVKREYLDELSATHKVAVVDATKWSGDGDFLDDHHLLPPGAVTFSRLLAEAMPGRRGSEPVASERVAGGANAGWKAGALR